MKHPNIVFIISDQHRWDFMGYEDNGFTHTPNLNRLAADGFRFSNAYCTAPLCSPSRAAVASGRYGMNSGCFTNLHELPAGTPGFVTQLRSAGYTTAAVGKTHMEIHAFDSDLTSEKHGQFMHSLGWDQVCEVSGNGMLKTGIKCAYSDFLEKNSMFKEVLEYYRKWTYFMEPEREGDHGFYPHEWPFSEELQETAFIGNSALKWLEDRDKTRPFFLHIGFAGPHSPIEPNPYYMSLYDIKKESPPFNAKNPYSWLASGRAGYRAMISQIDDYVGRIYNYLNSRNEL
ncbi:MAG: sulfatase-like hydrolase/transferase, partial [bacterium]